MAKYPPAIFKPVDRYKPGGSVHTPMPKPGRLCFHTAVSSQDSLFAQFNTSGNPVAHFYVRKDGTVEQYVNTDTRASANLDGNHDTISVESWDNGAPGGNVPDWTSAQVEACAKLAAWVHKEHNIPLDKCDASPNSRGVTWHRKGIDGNFPPGLLSGRKSGDERWSEAEGKICPGDKKIHGIVDDILPKARQLLTNGGDDMPQWDDQVPGSDGKTMSDWAREGLRTDEQFADIDRKFQAVNANVNAAEDRLNNKIGELIDAVKALG